VPDAGFLQELDIGQKRSLVCRELDRIKADAQNKAKTMLSTCHYYFLPLYFATDSLAGTLEMLLLLVWRHLVYYCEGHHINNPDLRAATSHAIRFLSSPDAETFQSEAGVRLAPVLQRLSMLDLVCLALFSSEFSVN
jgi:nuclear pore complex protein Nup205